jgi:hypothetical protein
LLWVIDLRRQTCTSHAIAAAVVFDLICVCLLVLSLLRRAGSVIAEIIVEYNYPNNESHIQFLNSEIDDELMEIFDPLALNTIGQAFGNVTIELNGLLLQPTVIRSEWRYLLRVFFVKKPTIFIVLFLSTDATDLEPYVKCQYANYTAKLNNGRWECVGACKRIPGYCHQHGECLNHIKDGPICR